MKKVFVETYGCQMNVYDTELVHTILEKENYTIVPNENDADIVLLNTCSVRDNANRKVFNRVHQIKNKRKEDPILVGVLGCMATNFRRKLLENPQLKIDFIAGPDSYKNLPNLIQNVLETGEKCFDVTLSEFETYSDVYPTREGGVNAWIAIMRGCNNYCTFCVVPHTRGRERSRDPDNIVDEVKRLVDDGYKQVTLLGQNVNSYHYEGHDFADLLLKVSDVNGIERIRYTSPHPKDFPLKLLNIMNERDNICKQLHMPLQSGSTRILEKMNRTYSQEEFLKIVTETRKIMPNANLSTDIIVGFCSETEEDYQETVKVVKEVEFDSAFIFKYSERPNTLASKRFEDDVTEVEKTKRITELVEIQKNISLTKNEAHIGTIQPVLIEKKGTKKNPDHFQGRNDGNTIVIVPPGDYQVGSIIPIRITGATVNALQGQPLPIELT